MAITLTMDINRIEEALKSATRDEKERIVDMLEKELLSEWDSYEETAEVKTRVNEAMQAYQKGDVVELRDVVNEL
jgi:hypothetical protein